MNFRIETFFEIQYVTSASLEFKIDKTFSKKYVLWSLCRDLQELLVYKAEKTRCKLAKKGQNYSFWDNCNQKFVPNSKKKNFTFWNF